MSGIYIKGMEMPTDNTILVRIFPASENGECYVQQLDIDGDVLAELWAVPVPEHGRLIDAEANIKALKKCAAYPETEIARAFYNYAASILDACPTIIPADKEADE